MSSGALGSGGVPAGGRYGLYLGHLGSAALCFSAMLVGVMVAGSTLSAEQILLFGWGSMSFLLWGLWLRYHHKQWRSPVSTTMGLWVSQCRRSILLGGLVASIFAAMTLLAPVYAICCSAFAWAAVPVGAILFAFTALRMRRLRQKSLRQYHQVHNAWG